LGMVALANLSPVAFQGLFQGHGKSAAAPRRSNSCAGNRTDDKRCRWWSSSLA
jgi:hypothetical protein